MIIEKEEIKYFVENAVKFGKDWRALCVTYNRNLCQLDHILASFNTLLQKDFNLDATVRQSARVIFVEGGACIRFRNIEYLSDTDPLRGNQFTHIFGDIIGDDVRAVLKSLVRTNNPEAREAMRFHP